MIRRLNLDDVRTRVLSLEGLGGDTRKVVIDLCDELSAARNERNERNFARRKIRSERDEALRLVEEYRSRKSAAYTERNKLVALLARLVLAEGGNAGLRKHVDVEGEQWDPEWRTLVAIDLPTGQVAWHFHDSDVSLVEGLPEYKGEWDGHDTEEKYRRVLACRTVRRSSAHPEPINEVLDVSHEAKDELIDSLNAEIVNLRNAMVQRELEASDTINNLRTDRDFLLDVPREASATIQGEISRRIDIARRLRNLTTGPHEGSKSAEMYLDEVEARFAEFVRREREHDERLRDIADQLRVIMSGDTVTPKSPERWIELVKARFDELLEWRSPTIPMTFPCNIKFETRVMGETSYRTEVFYFDPTNTLLGPERIVGWRPIIGDV